MSIKKEDVTSITKDNIIKIQIKGITHLSFRLDMFVGFQSWIVNDSWFIVEIYMLQGDPILLEYDNRIIWERVISSLDNI